MTDLFQSTLSVRRATALYSAILPSIVISIHALRKESDTLDEMYLHLLMISIHALRKESDGYSQMERASSKNFNPRSP